MRRPKVVVIMSRLGSGAGAEATLTDFCQAIVHAGGACVVVVGKSSRKQRADLYKRISGRGKHSQAKLQIVVSSRLLDFRVSPSVRLVDVIRGTFGIWSLRFVLDPRRITMRVALKSADHILVGQVLTARGVTELRDLSPSAVLTLNHNGEPKDFSSQWRFLVPKDPKTPIQNYLEYLRSFDRFLFQNEGQRLAFESHSYPGIGPTTVIWASCDERGARLASTLDNPFDPSETNLVCVAKFQRSKNQLGIIRAFEQILREHPSARLTFVGDSINDRSYLYECQSFVTQHQLSNYVDFVGYRDDALRFIAHCDIFVLVSEGEGTSRAVREAAFLARPIVSRRLEGVESFLGPNGAIWVRGDDATSALAQALDDTVGRSQVADAGRARYEQFATQDKFSASVTSFFGLGQHRPMS